MLAKKLLRAGVIAMALLTSSANADPLEWPEPIDFNETTPPPAAPVTVVYSETQGKTCKQTASESELSEWVCSAPGGRTVLFGDTGNIAIVRFGAPTNTRLEPEFRVDGDMIGKKIEWRLREENRSQRSCDSSSGMRMTGPTRFWSSRRSTGRTHAIWPM